MILLARHGQTDDNAAGRLQGSRDSSLNDRGRREARELAAAASAEEIAALYTSGLRRARETAAIVGEIVGLEPRVDDRLAESRRGAWEGRRLDDIAREEPELWAAWRRAGPGFRFPGGESLAEHAERVAAALDAIRGGPLPALAICHGGTIRCAYAAGHPRGLDAFHEVEVPNAKLMRLPG